MLQHFVPLLNPRVKTFCCDMWHQLRQQKYESQTQNPSVQLKKASPPGVRDGTMLSYRYNRSHAIAGKAMRPVSFGGGGGNRHVRGPRRAAVDVRLVMIVLWAPDNVTLL